MAEFFSKKNSRTELGRSPAGPGSRRHRPRAGVRPTYATPPPPCLRQTRRPPCPLGQADPPPWPLYKPSPAVTSFLPPPPPPLPSSTSMPPAPRPLAASGSFEAMPAFGWRNGSGMAAALRWRGRGHLCRVPVCFGQVGLCRPARHRRQFTEEEVSGLDLTYPSHLQRLISSASHTPLTHLLTLQFYCPIYTQYFRETQVLIVPNVP